MLSTKLRELTADYGRSLFKNQVIDQEELIELLELTKSGLSKEASRKPEVLKLFTRCEVSGSLQISMRTLDRMTKEGKIPCVKIGKAIRYRVEDINKFIGNKHTAIP